jgi:hypothetical protein
LKLCFDEDDAACMSLDKESSSITIVSILPVSPVSDSFICGQAFAYESFASARVVTGFDKYSSEILWVRFATPCKLEYLFMQ